MFLLVASSDRFRGEKVPTLQEAVEECIKRQLIIYFDVKGHPDEVPLTVTTYFESIVGGTVSVHHRFLLSKNFIVFCIRKC